MSNHFHLLCEVASPTGRPGLAESIERTIRSGCRPSISSSLQARDAITFIRHIARDHGSRHAQLLVAALRSFFRFLHYRGETETDLAPALPNVANWALSSLPKHISVGEVQRVLHECDRQTVVGRRNERHAIASGRARNARRSTSLRCWKPSSLGA
jgi:site-specific recombinase XerD